MQKHENFAKEVNERYDDTNIKTRYNGYTDKPLAIGKTKAIGDFILTVMEKYDMEINYVEPDSNNPDMLYVEFCRK